MAVRQNVCSLTVNRLECLNALIELLSAIDSCSMKYAENSDDVRLVDLKDVHHTRRCTAAQKVDASIYA